jgi:hypothetical protein
MQTITTTARDVAAKLKDLGVEPDRTVRVVIEGEALRAIVEDMRGKAVERGMSDELFDRLMSEIDETGR